MTLYARFVDASEAIEVTFDAMAGVNCSRSSLQKANAVKPSD